MSPKINSQIKIPPTSYGALPTPALHRLILCKYVEIAPEGSGLWIDAFPGILPKKILTQYFEKNHKHRNNRMKEIHG